ncbi:MAG: hypothetical protein ACFFAU_01625 [Candidatus Hodarchaeota archaeon]
MAKKKKKTVEDLLKELEESLTYLSFQFRIPGMQPEDVKQELIVKVLEDWKKYKDKRREKGFWFLRLKWHLLNLIKASQRDPLNLSVNINILNQK